VVRIRTSGSKQGNNCIVFTLTVLTINDLFCILQMLLMVNTVTVNADFMRCVEGDDWKCESGAFSDLPLDSQFAVLEDMRQYMEEFRDHQPTSPHFEKNLQTQLGSITVRPWMLAADMEYYASIQGGETSFYYAAGIRTLQCIIGIIPCMIGIIPL
jgi:hypothetical protein